MTKRAVVSRCAPLIASAHLAAAALFAASSAIAGPTCGEALSERIPARKATALHADEFVQRAANMDADGREQLIAYELLEGNMPRFLRRLAAVPLDGVRPDGRPFRLTLCVSPDYLSIGSDTRYLLIPMRLDTARTVAARHGFVLPTARIVDAIYRESAIRLMPQPLPASSAMRSTAYYQWHDGLVREQLRGRDAWPGALTAGHKKDLVESTRLQEPAQRVAIYGWHQPGGRAIQPLSTVHGHRYVDYSHGVRLISTTAYLDGAPRDIGEILSDPELAQALSEEPAATPRKILR